MTARDKRLERAQMRVLFTVPFFAPAVAKLPVVWDKSIETACTNGQDIHWNPDWFDELPDPVLPTVLCHEAQHCLLGHLWRAPHGVDWDIWNQATDHAVNLGLKEFSALVMGKRLADPFPFPQPEEAFCANPAFSDMAEEKIYAILSAKKGGGGGGGGQPKPGKGGGGKGGKAPGQGNGPGQGGSQPGQGPSSMPSFGQMSQPAQDPAAQAQSKALQNSWDNTLIQSVTLAKGRGECPGSLERLVSELVNPTVPWQELLRSWLREQCADDWDFMTPAMEYSDSGFILPSLKSDKVGTVVFGTDWSGSTQCVPGLVDQFHGEKQSVLDDLRPRLLVDIGFDSRIVWEKEYTAGETMDKSIHGGGGTDFRPLFERCDHLEPAPKAVVVLTDLDGNFPDNHPAYPVVWVCWDKEAKAPFGTVVYASRT